MLKPLWLLTYKLTQMPMPPIQQKVLKINPTERQNEDIETVNNFDVFTISLT